MKKIIWNLHGREGGATTEVVIYEGIRTAFSISKRRKTKMFYISLQTWRDSKRSEKNPTGYKMSEAKELGEFKELEGAKAKIEEVFKAQHKK